MAQDLSELWSVVASIPPGRAASYGDVGRALTNPASGYMVGRWMAQCPETLPWWRVVGKGGELRTSRRDPRLAIEQRERLRAEGAPLKGDLVEMDACRWVPEHQFSGRPAP